MSNEKKYCYWSYSINCSFYFVISHFSDQFGYKHNSIWSQTKRKSELRSKFDKMHKLRRIINFNLGGYNEFSVWGLESFSILIYSVLFWRQRKRSLITAKKNKEGPKWTVVFLCKTFIKVSGKALQKIIWDLGELFPSALSTVKYTDFSKGGGGHFFVWKQFI